MSVRTQNQFNATRQKRDLLAAETGTDSAGSHLHGDLTQGQSPSEGSCPQECLNGAVCTEAGVCDCQMFQAHGERCQIVPNDGKDRDGICKSWGQYHFETFDGIYYYFPGNCSYIFAKDCSAPEPQYTVWVHNSPQCDGSVYSCLRSISLFFASQEEIVIVGQEVKKESIRLTLPQTIGNVFIERLADYILVKTTFGFSLAWDGSTGIYIKLTEEHKGKPCGLCGNYNGNKSDDLIIQNSEYTEDIAVFANSWSVQTPDDAICVTTASDFSSPCSTDTESSELRLTYCSVYTMLGRWEKLSRRLSLCFLFWWSTGVAGRVIGSRFSGSSLGDPLGNPASIHAECTIVGDSHFTTFDGRHYTFLGICQYILVKGTGKDKFTITLQKAPCGQNLDHACIQSVTLVLEDDMSKQVTLTRDGEIQFGPSQGFNFNGDIEIRNLSSLFVQLKTRFGLKIQFAKDGERLYIQVNTSWKRRTLGLCGTFNGNLRDDFLSPAGMIEGTPQLHANAWKVSSACFAPVNVPVVDPCNVNQQNVGYASHCDIINQELFAPCHPYVSPGLYYQLCRFDACKCGSSCLCNALAHYAYICGKHGIAIDFRSHVSYCALVCRSGMLYHRCSSFCGHSCSSLSAPHVCNDDCAEGCNCPDGKYFEESINFCVPVAKEQLISFNLHFTFEVHTCPEGKIYYDCRYSVPGLPAAGVNCEISCANLAMNFTCVPSPPCASGCICPPGMAEHKGKCYVPDSCPCTWKDWEYLSGEVIATPCYTCVCRRGIFTCTSYPCPAVCTVYGDRHYYTFDGLEYDYVSDCQAYLVKSKDNSNVSVIAQNKKCFDNDIVCSKSVLISIGDTEIYFSEPSDKQGKLAGLCGNFDKYTSNDLTTSNNMEVRNAQVFGESWAIGQCKSPNETIKPCEVHQSKFPYAKRECSILYSDVFAPCRNVIDVTSFVKNCHTDTCNCNLGGDCECLCTSIAAYAYKCCQQGAAIHWRSPSVCPYNCEYYNQGLGEGPYILASYGQNDTVIGANITSRKLFPLPRISTYENVGFSFMITPGLFKDKDLSLSLVSLESAERPNYFLYVHDNETVTLEQWSASSSFRRRATFFHHQGLWIPDYSAFELHNKKGFFIILTASGIKVSKYDDSEEFKHTSSFSIEDLHASVPYRRMCEWRYEPCASPCFKTCSDPEGVACKFLPPVEGCLPYCPKNMILDEVTLKCVYPEDCIPVTPTELAAGTKTQRTRPTALIFPTIVTTERFPQMPPIFVTAEAEAEPTHTIVTTKITTKIDTTLRGANTTAETLSDFHSLASPQTTTYLTDSLPISSTMQSSKVTHSTASLSVLPKPVSSTDFPATLQTSAVTLKTSPTASPTVFITSPITTMAVPSTPAFTLLTASPRSRHSTLPTPTSLVVTPFSLEAGTASPSTALASLSPGPAFVTTEIPTRIWGTRRPSTSHSQLPKTSTVFPSSASLTGRTSFSSPTFFTSSQLILTASTSPLSTMTERTSSTVGQPIVHPASVYGPTSTVFQTPMATSRFTSFETSPPQLITASYLVTTQATSQTTTTSLRTASSLTRTSVPTFLSSMDISVTPSKHIVPLSTDTLSTIPPLTETSSPVASQIPTTMRTTWSSLSPLVTHTMSTLMLPPITSPKPKATGEVTVVSKSLFLGPSTTSASLLATPQISEMSVTSTISTESKYALPTDAFPISAISKRLTTSISSTAFPFSTPVLPINATLSAHYQMARTTSKITEYPISPHSDFKTASVVRSTDTSLTSRELSGAKLSFTSPSTLLTMLSSSRPSVSKASAMTSHTTSSSVIPTVNRTSALISNITLTQSPIVSMGTQETSRSPHTELATSPVGISTLTLGTNIYISPSAVPKTSFALPHLLTSKTPKVTLESYSSIFTTTSSPPSETSHVSTVSLGTNISLSPSTEYETRTFVPTEIVTHSTVPSVALTMSTALSTTSLVPTYVTMKTSVSPSRSLLVTPATTITPSATAKSTESSVTHIELYKASSSVPIPATSQTHMYPSPETLLASAHSLVSLSTKEMLKPIVMKTTGAMTAFSDLKITPSAASDLKYATSIGRTADTIESSQTSHVQKNITKTKSTTTEKSSLLHSTFSSVQTTSLPSQSSITSGKSVSISEVSDVTLSDWSRIPPQRTIKPSYNLTEPEQVGTEESQSTTVTDSSHFSYAKVLSSTTEPVETQTSLTDTDMMMRVTADNASYGTMIHTLMSSSSDCMPRYIEPVDRCSQYVCINMGWMLYNVSRNCHKNVEKPDCGFRGMPVQVNSDSCCPEWECPCQCSVLSELSIITFDGNNIALYNMASYILVKLPGEIIVAHIEKCPTNRVVVDSLIQPLPFSKHGLCIQDTGAMYVINTPAGISIKWAHVTGIIDIQYGLHSNTSTKTEGLCGVCNGDPVDDLKMQNRTIITNMEEIEAFIKSWEIEKSVDVATRRPVRNCTEDNCTYCMELLNRRVFVPCHKKVSPQDFCEKMWINNTYFWNYECDALSAYVALCNKHNICIKWRTPDYCSLGCPDGKEYQPCVQPCAAKTCLNKWFYEESPCSYLREDCVCKNGTILHRTDSDLCIPEEKCACTDNEGQPRSAGEVWNGSIKGCCMYKCLENGSVIAIEPECSEDPLPICEREGEVIINVIEERACCPKKVCECNMTLCEAIIPTCKNGEKLMVGYSTLSCCPQYQCVCESCIEPVPLCNEGEILTVDLSTMHSCCPRYHCEKDAVCVFQEVTVLNPGQSMIQYLDENLCYTVQCLQEKDHSTGYHAMDFTVVNCSQQCDAHQIYIPSPSHHACCGTCQNVSCAFYTENGTLSVHEEGSTWVSNCTKYECAKTAVGAMILGSSVVCPPFNETECTKEGSTWVSNCTKYECAKTAVGAMILGSSVVCPPFNETECTKNGGTVQTYNDGCCKTSSCQRTWFFTIPFSGSNMGERSQAQGQSAPKALGKTGGMWNPCAKLLIPPKGKLRTKWALKNQSASILAPGLPTRSRRATAGRRPAAGSQRCLDSLGQEQGWPVALEREEMGRGEWTARVAPVRARGSGSRPARPCIWMEERRKGGAPGCSFLGQQRPVLELAHRPPPRARPG
ncbi:Otogelin [Chelonia mydas]|uniref:Otogelin n=1 Tax=Chelonia mydas TaxID=8469 RepID=M7BWQ9_CHEMY|nr:Otogelin [Chelonia mydas]